MGRKLVRNKIFDCDKYVNILVMKIWGNDLKVGDTIYYECHFDIRQSTVKKIDTMTFKMPSLILENGNRIFVNEYYYTEKQEVIDNILEELKNKLSKVNNEINIKNYAKELIKASSLLSDCFFRE